MESGCAAGSCCGVQPQKLATHKSMVPLKVRGAGRQAGRQAGRHSITRSWFVLLVCAGMCFGFQLHMLAP
jgi:hypothetical protein